MKLKDIPKEELELMGYDDIALLILQENGKKMKLHDIFAKVCQVLELPEETVDNEIMDFFELMSINKKFIMLDKGYWDLQTRHKLDIVFEDEEEDEDDLMEEDEEENNDDIEREEDDDLFYDEDDDTVDDTDDDLADLMVVDDLEESEDKMFNRLDAIEEKYNELTTKLSNPEVLSNFNQVKELSKEHSDLEETVKTYQAYKQAKNNLEEAKMMVEDPDLKEIALEDVENLTKEIDRLYHELEILLVPKDENDGKNVIMEIRGAAGGDEANIFAGDLFRMYSYYAEANGWKIEVIHQIEGTSGGFSQIEFMVKGANVYSKLKYESGSHRVQRVPVTETQGRVHTSTSTVLVMPEVDNVNIDIKESDLKIDVYHSSGAGGQSVNTANSAVRITHVPTGVVVTCQTERSQLRNKERAMQLLKIKINDELMHEQESAIGATRKSKIGSGDRSEKIRTYNYPQNRVTDHRINFSIMSLDRVMDGDLEPVIEALINEDLKLKLAGMSLE